MSVPEPCAVVLDELSEPDCPEVELLPLAAAVSAATALAASTSTAST